MTRPLATCGLLLIFAVPSWANDPTGLTFFEQKIRPVLIKECYSCHSEETKKGPKGNFRVDTAALLRMGGDSGPAVVPGKPLESQLLKAMRGDEVAMMPPKGKLPDDILADFEKWIKMGAPDPRGGAAITRAAVDVEAGRQFWSFRAVARHPAPTVQDTTWPRGEIDRFLLAKLEAASLRPAPDADRRTLIRRVTIDLTGLLPTPDEVAAFLADPADTQDALVKVVDRLLDSPHYGERWGRHWLDVVRYADSNGKDENFVFHEAFRFRDYVISSFNRDKPFDQLVREHIAGDLLPASSPSQAEEQLTGTGFLVLGPKVLAERDKAKLRMDVIDEQIDTVGKAFLGMTLGCARCHDHKFDPVPQTDYYALAGIFGSTHTLHGEMAQFVSGWNVRPLGPDGEKQAAAFRAHKQKIAAREKELTKFKAELKTQEDIASMRVPAKLVGITVDDSEATFVGTWKASTFSQPYVGKGYQHDDRLDKGKKSATFTPKLPRAGEYEVYVSYTPGSNRAKNVPIRIQCADGEKRITLDQSKPPQIDNLFQKIGKFRFASGSMGTVTIETTGTEGYVMVDAVRFVPLGGLDESEMAMGVPPEVRAKLNATQAKVREIEEEIKKLKASTPPEPPAVLAVNDEPQIEDAKLNIRGNHLQLGPVVPRGFLSVATPKGVQISLPAKQSGRLELAQWLSSPENPLTARVYVNRVWMHLFGEGLVRTVDNFGTQGEKPTHPELLDELAGRFVQEGWSTKRLIRSLVLSRAYRMSSEVSAEAAKLDPENRLLSRAARRRAEAEVIRDGILTVAGTLDRTVGGPSTTGMGIRAIENSSKGSIVLDSHVRRSVYLPIIRNELPSALEVFDFADPDVSTGRRDSTTVPTQALFLMNSRFVMEQSRQAAKKLLALSGDDAARLTDLYQRALNRSPRENELASVKLFLAHYRTTLAKLPSDKPVDASVEAWAAVCRAVFGSTEFRFVE